MRDLKTITGTAKKTKKEITINVIVEALKVSLVPATN